LHRRGNVKVLIPIVQQLRNETLKRFGRRYLIVRSSGLAGH
jgi:hypothetical protein